MKDLRSAFAIVLVGVVAALAVEVSPASDSGWAHAARDDDVRATVTKLDAATVKAWAAAEAEDAGQADALLLARRLSLALTGTIPSLQEIRRLQALPEKQRLDAHLEALLSDRRFADYLAERLARTFVGTDEGPFLVFRRRRFVYWISDNIAADHSYAKLVRDMVDARGLWTDRPGVNFLTAQALDPVRLTARTTRAFLGMRLDCAQCHDHPFADWKQSDFAGLAAHYAGLEQSITGVRQHPTDFEPAGRMMKPAAGMEKAAAKKTPADKTAADKTAADKTAAAKTATDSPSYAPAVPFAKHAISEGQPRRSLAHWITSQDNHAFGKNIANRMWTMMLGRSLTRTGPDDIEGAERIPDAMVILADDFVQHGHRLKRLIRVIAHSRAFSRRAASPLKQSDLFAAFPQTKLRPEQLAGALVQASSLQTLDADTHIFGRLASAGNTKDFVRRYGELGDDELAERDGTVTQHLVMMNGRIVRQRTKANLLSASGRIGMLAASNTQRVKVAFLVMYTRLPSATELKVFRAALEGKKDKARKRAMEDMMWALVNATEFSWSH